MNRYLREDIHHWTFMAHRSVPETFDRRNPDFFLRPKMASQTQAYKISTRSTTRALGITLPRCRVLKGCTRCARIIATELCRTFEIDKGIADAGKKITNPSGVLGRCRHRQCRGHELEPGRHGRPMLSGARLSSVILTRGNPTRRAGR